MNSQLFILRFCSREAEIAGIKEPCRFYFNYAYLWSIAFPLGIMTAIYLEEIAPKIGLPN